MRIVLEHVSTASAIRAVKSKPPNVAATITPHHLMVRRPSTCYSSKMTSYSAARRRGLSDRLTCYGERCVLAANTRRCSEARGDYVSFGSGRPNSLLLCRCCGAAAQFLQATCKNRRGPGGPKTGERRHADYRALRNAVGEITIRSEGARQDSTAAGSPSPVCMNFTLATELLFCFHTSPRCSAQVVRDGDSHFFLGSDSAPHPR